MKWMRNRFLLLPYLVLLTVLAVVGCTSKEDPSEVLLVCGNHSCGELTMVTTDTASDGFHYLNPSLSPNGDKILFTADWWAIPADPRQEGDDLFVENRQMIIMDVREGTDPQTDLASQDAGLVFVFPRNVSYGGGEKFLSAVRDDDKSGPIWQDDSHVIFSMRDVNIGEQYRLCRANVDDLGAATFDFLFMEPSDGGSSPQSIHHLSSALSPIPAAPASVDQRWLAFVRSGCRNSADLSTCSGMAIWVIDMSTAGAGDGYSTTAFPVTSEYSRIESPRWSPDGTRLIFSGGMDVGGSGTGSGTELFTVDLDTTGLAGGTMELDHNLQRLTYTELADGDPISGILNTSPMYSVNGGTVYFVSTRRAPAITLHDRNVWRMPADGSQDPEIYFFSRYDDVDPTVLPDGRVMLSSSMGFPTEMLNRLEEQAYQDALVNEDLDLTEIQYREYASDQRHLLELFEGVMSHIYIYRP